MDTLLKESARERELLQQERSKLQAKNEKPQYDCKTSLIENPKDPEIVGDKLIHIGNITFDYSAPLTIYGNEFEISEPSPIASLNSSAKGIIALGKVVNFEAKETKNKEKLILSFGITDDEGSLNIKLPLPKNEAEGVVNAITGTKYKSARGTVDITMYKAVLAVKGKVVKDNFDDERYMLPDSIMVISSKSRCDTNEEKRVELHLHTNMSAKDATIIPSELIKIAESWGHKAIAVTDHGNVQAFPDLMNAAAKSDIKVIYGMEAYYVDDTAKAVYGNKNEKINGRYVVFDLETTGLSVLNCEITEIGAVRIENGEVTDVFSSFVNPGIHIPEEITKITGITDEMVKDAPSVKDALKSFLDFIGDDVLIAHNANFDTSFIRSAASKYKLSFKNTYIDTVALSKYVNPDLKKHTLDSIAEYYKLGDFNHHRASDDAKMLAEIFFKMIVLLKNEGAQNLDDVNRLMSERADPKKQKVRHMIILVKDLIGLKNLYKIISASYLEYFYRYPRIPKSLLEEYRDGLIIGSACEAGEVYQAILSGASDEILDDIISFYDYLEIQPLSNNMFMVDEGTLGSEEDLKNINRRICELGEKYNKPVCATCDAHYLEKHDNVYRQILITSMKYKGAYRDSGLYLKTTDEMLKEFSYLGEEKAREVVITNPNKIADMTEKIRPIPEGTFTPNIEGSEEELQDMCWNTARRIYGDDLPEIVSTRLDKELKSVISNGYAVLYIIAQKLVKFSEDNGYLVGSRGSVGSSFIATMAGISEVNPLPPHYVCPKCKHSEFVTDGSIGSGFDLPPKNCPNCGTDMHRDGHDIPFETFLGFNGDKSPDIDLNFSGEVQAKVHKFTEDLFGTENVFKAGTLSAIAEKTAFGYVKKFEESLNVHLNRSETERLIQGISGVKNTTGQHPGGIVVIPKELEVYDFTPVQHPADDANSDIVTTHFAFSYLHDTILKLDELGHDIPTKYRWLEDYSGIKIDNVPMCDEKVMELFLSTKSLGVSPDDIFSQIGTFGLPEFGTSYVQQVVVATKPKTFSDLLQISGLTHGTDVWTNNGEELIKSGTCTISDLIGTRDSIMLYLIYHGVEKLTAFKIMEDVRKGRGVKPEYEKAMLEANVPEWYIDSCRKIKYMFPKAHATAYVISAIRLAWYKVYHPKAFYAAFFTAAPNGFDASIVAKGPQNVRNTLDDFLQRRRNKKIEKKEEQMIPFLQLANEAICRGIKFLPIDLYKSSSFQFIPEEEGIRIPFNTLSGVGDSAAVRINEVVKQGEIMSIDDLRVKAGLTKSVIATLQQYGVLKGLSATNQMSFMDAPVPVQQQKEDKQNVEVSDNKPKQNDDAKIASESDQISLF